MNPTPAVQPPSHARRWKQQEQGSGNMCFIEITCLCIPFLGIITCCSHGIGSQNVKKRGRGPVRALTVIAKRIKAGKQQLDIQFTKHGGPVCVNYRSFVDEGVMYTRKRAPIIGVKSWKMSGKKSETQ
jgi:hypothetical protein